MNTNNASVRVEAPTFEHHREALGIGEASPRLTWINRGEPGWALSRAEIQLIDDGPRRSYVLPLDDSVLVPWPFEPLVSRQRATIRVRVMGRADSDWSAWSDPSTVEAGLLHPDDWIATAVGPPWTEDGSTPRRPVLLRGETTLGQDIQVARLYISAHGVFEAQVNGRRIGDDVLAPGWTSYPSRLVYSTYDVTELVSPGTNALGIWLADGWFRGRLGFHGGHIDNYGTHVAAIAQLVVEHRDGTVATFATDDSWTTAPSPIVSSGLLEGEVYDAQEESPGWSEQGFVDSAWIPVARRAIDPAVLVAPSGPPIRRVETLRPTAIDRRADGRLLIDFGQNVVGRVSINVVGKRGQRIRIRHAEVLQDGELYTRPLRGATSVDEYVLKGDPAGERWEPRFTIHGFRHIEVIGWSGDVPEDGVVAHVIHTDMQRTGWFDSSDPLLNRLHENVVWSMRGNFVGLPTDCPQRDERLGWTGDIQVFAPTAAFLYDCSGLLASWLQDVAAEQLPDGTVPWYVPVIPGGDQWTPIRPGAGWGDAATLTPWDAYFRFGDIEFLSRQLASSTAWVDLVSRLAGPGEVWDSGYQLGDWLDPTAPPEAPERGSTDPHLVASAYFARSSERLALTLETLNAPDAVVRRAKANQVRAAFRRRFVSAGGSLSSESQTAYSLAIVFGLLDSDEVAFAGRRLASLVEEVGFTLTTGFLGTPLVLDALTKTGHRAIAHRLLNQRSMPSWLWPVTQGATTIWERWDSLLEDGSVNPGDMTSFNHYAFGSVADWMHREIAGITAEEPGWRKIRFRPGVESGLTFAAASHLTPRGTASISWKRDGESIVVAVEVPVNASAVLELPGGTTRNLGSGPYRETIPAPRPPIDSARVDGELAVRPPATSDAPFA